MYILCTFVSLSIYSTTLTFINMCPEHEKDFLKLDLYIMATAILRVSKIKFLLRQNT